MNSIVVVRASDGAETTLGEIARRHDHTLIDLWSSTCPRCPASVKALDAMDAPATAKVALLCRDDGPGVAESVRRATSTVTHITLKNATDIELLKKHLGFAYFPFAVLVDSRGGVTQTHKEVTRITPLNFTLEADF
jgi:hypothetical protein